MIKGSGVYKGEVNEILDYEVVPSGILLSSLLYGVIHKRTAISQTVNLHTETSTKCYVNIARTHTAVS